MGMIKCPKCQSEIDEQTNVCPKCGYVFEGEKDTKRKTGMKKIVICIVALVLFIGIIVAAVLGFNYNAEKQQALQLNSEIEQIGQIVWKNENQVVLDKFSQEAKEAFIDKNKVGNYLNKLYDLQSQYDKMNDKQKSYIKNYSNLKNAIEAFERKKKTYDIMDELSKPLPPLPF